MKKILIAGSIAYDHIMEFEGEFKDSILAESHLNKLSVSFFASKKEINFGGCAPNIAYNLHLLHNKSYVIGVAGNDFDKYKRWLKSKNINTDFIVIDKNNTTAAAYIITDNNQAQIAIFYPGAIFNQKLGFKLQKNKLKDFSYAIISPEFPERMSYWAKLFKSINLPYIFDPGQAIPAFSKTDIVDMIKYSNGMILNEYEIKLICKKTGLSLNFLINNLDFLIITLGANGCRCYTKDNAFTVKAIPKLKAFDITGCGDAFRAGFLHGIVNGYNLKRACAMGNTAASYLVEIKGTQNHHYSIADFNKRLIKYYGK